MSREKQRKTERKTEREIVSPPLLERLKGEKHGSIADLSRAMQGCGGLQDMLLCLSEKGL
jgi:hypothetical protein